MNTKQAAFSLKAFMRDRVWRLEAIGFAALMRYFACRTPEQASNAGAKLLGFIGPFLSAHKTASRNLRLAFPEKSAAQIKDITHKMWAEIGRNIGEMPHLSRLRIAGSSPQIELRGAGVLDRIRDSGRGAIFVSGHLGNWEVMAATLFQARIPFEVTYRPPNNPYVDVRIQALRSDYGIEAFVAKRRAALWDLMISVEAGKSLTFLIDQKYDEGLAIPFFGHAAMTMQGPIRIARRCKVPIVMGATRRIAPGRFVVEVEEPLVLSPLKGEDGVRADLVTINRYLESKIRECPEQWFWVHRRWPRAAWDHLGEPVK